MSDHIELHDSSLAVKLAGTAVVLQLCPAYVHHWERSAAGWIGEGRSQAAEIIVPNAELRTNPGGETFEVADGWIEVRGRRYENMIPVPLHDAGVVSGQIVLVNGGPLVFAGRGIDVRLVGEPSRIEALPPEWAPGA